MSWMTFLLAVILVWNANREPDLAGYKLYQGPRRATYTNVTTLGPVTTNAVKGLQPGGHFVFAVTAFNTSGAESDFSNELVWNEPRVFRMRWAADPGGVYQIWWTAGLSEWFGWVQGPTLIATEECLEWEEPTAEPMRFYRVTSVTATVLETE